LIFYQLDQERKGCGGRVRREAECTANRNAITLSHPQCQEQGNGSSW